MDRRAPLALLVALMAVAAPAKPAAKAFFATLKGAERYAVLYRVNAAKTAKTRSALIEKFVAMLARGETVHGAKKRG